MGLLSRLFGNHQEEEVFVPVMLNEDDSHDFLAWLTNPDNEAQIKHIAEVSQAMDEDEKPKRWNPFRR